MDRTCNCISYKKKLFLIDRVFDLINEKINKEKDYILFSFGEIDCRVFLQTKIEYFQEEYIKNKKNKKEVIEEVVDKYFNTLTNKYSEYNLIFWGPVASYREDLTEYKFGNMLDGNDKFFTGGKYTCKQRNEITKIFTERLEILCEKNNIICLTMFYDMVNKNMLTKYEMTDGVIHLNCGTFKKEGHIDNKEIIIKKFKKIIKN